ncbi:MAG: transcription antitermination factor NusB [Chloroflexota bacterium]|nr:transcription antitermination factor NusB [Chloroflexota bacterium]
MTPRRRARMAALEALFETDFHERDLDQLVRERLERTQLTRANQEFAHRLVHGVAEHKAEIDLIMAEAAPQWPVEQIAPVDKNVLRLAIYEVMFDNSAPAKVAISEAIELARLFGSSSSPKFVNGVLGAVMGKIGAQHQEAAEEVK